MIRIDATAKATKADMRYFTVGAPVVTSVIRRSRGVRYRLVALRGLVVSHGNAAFSLSRVRFNWALRSRAQR